MKSLKRISLFKLEEKALSDQSMRCLKGGGACSCGCHYAGSGGSSSGDNDSANYDEGKTSYGGGSESCECAGSEGSRISDFWKGY